MVTFPTVIKMVQVFVDLQYCLLHSIYPHLLLDFIMSYVVLKRDTVLFEVEKGKRGPCCIQNKGGRNSFPLALVHCELQCDLKVVSMDPSKRHAA